MIMIISGYNLARKISMTNPYWSEWVTTFLCDNPRISSPKEIITDLSFLIVIWDFIVVLDFSTHTVLIGYMYYVSGQESSLVIISAHIRTCRRSLNVFHCIEYPNYVHFNRLLIIWGLPCMQDKPGCLCLYLCHLCGSSDMPMCYVLWNSCVPCRRPDWYSVYQS